VADAYIRVANVVDLPPGEVMRAKAHGYELCLANIDGTVYIIGNECPHASWPLSEGFLDGEEIICPGHNMSFNIPNYKKVSPYDPGMKHYPVKVEDGGIWVGDG